MKKLIEKLSRFYSSRWLPFIIICFGILLRLRHYLSNRSLWVDEVNLALDVVSKSFLQLFQKLDYRLLAPFGFLMAEKLMVQIFGSTEYVLRAFPCMAGVISLFLFYKVAQWFIGPKAVPIALGLFAISEKLIYYSAEVKQYSSDVAIALLLFVMAIYIQSKRLTAQRIVFFGVAGVIAIWFAFIATFVLVGLAVSQTILYVIKKEWIKIRQLTIIYLIWLLGFIAYSYIFISNVDVRSLIEAMRFRYHFAIITFPPMSLGDIGRNLTVFFEIFRNPTGFYLYGIAAFVFLVGCISMFKEKKEKLLVLVSPLLITLLAALLLKYPLYRRSILFLVPFLLLFIAEGVMHVVDKTRLTSPAIGVILIGLLFCHPLLSAHSLLKDPPTREEIKPVIKYIKDHKQKGDLIYVYYASRKAFQYYSKRYDLHDSNYIVGISSRDHWGNYREDLDKLRGIKRVWVLFSHAYIRKGVNEEKLFLFYLDSIGTQLDCFRDKGAAVYLYDLSKKAPNKDRSG